MATQLGITRGGESLDNIVWDILGQTYKPVQLSEASFAFDTLFPPAPSFRRTIIPTRTSSFAFWKAISTCGWKAGNKKPPRAI
jgi:hypothetical protein